MSRNTLYLIIGALVALLVVGGYLYYQDQQTNKIEIKLGNDGISIQSK